MLIHTKGKLTKSSNKTFIRNELVFILSANSVKSGQAILEHKLSRGVLQRLQGSL